MGMSEIRNTFKLIVLAVRCQVGAGVQRFTDSLYLRFDITTNDLGKSISDTPDTNPLGHTAGRPRLHCASL